jgi:hypothetical protein
MGAISWVYQITESIAVKYPRDEDSNGLERESDIYNMLERHTPCPYVMQSFCHNAEVNFLPFMLGSLDTQKTAPSSKLWSCSRKAFFLVQKPKAI